MPKFILIDKKSQYTSGITDKSIPSTALCFIKETCELYTQGLAFGNGSLEAYVKTDDPRLSDARSNPHAISFKGYVEKTYDGSSAVEIELPTSLPASDVYEWAKADTKPSYTYDEVGAAAADHSHDNYIITDIGTEGTGNAVTGWSVTNGKLTLKKESTYLVASDLSTYALLDSPAFTGKPTAPTVKIESTANGTSIATNEAVITFVEGKNYITKDSDITGNAATATKLKNSVTLTLGGNLSGSTTFDGSAANITLNATIVYTQLKSGTNLDTLKTDGWYNSTGSDAITNAPADLIANKEFSIHVEKIVKVANTYTIRQVCHQSNSEWTRHYDTTTSKWSAWENAVTNASEYLTENFVTTGEASQEIKGRKVFKGGATILGTGYGAALLTQGVVGVDSTGSASDLYLGYGSNYVIKLGTTGAHFISADGSKYSGTAANATQATKAIQDGDGNVIKETYAKKTDSFYIGDTAIALNQATGTIKSLNIDITGNAASATKAAQDADGNVLKDTYAKKTDVFYLGATEIKLNQGVNTITKLTGIEVEGTISGNSSTATKWANPMTLTVTGAVTGSVSFDGSQPSTLDLDVNHHHDSLYLKKIGGDVTGAINTKGNINFTGSEAATQGITGKYNTNHEWRLVHKTSGSAATNEVELAVTGNDKILVRRYTASYGGVSKEITLLDESGNTTFPGVVTATKFVGAVTGNADSATKATQDGAGNVITDTYAQKDQKFFLGTTEIAINRASGAITLSGVSIDGSAKSAETVTNGVYTTANNTLSGNNTFSGTTTFSNDLWVTGGKSLKFTPTTSSTDNGLKFYKQDKSATIAGIGVVSSGDTLTRIYLGWGATPSTEANSLSVDSNNVKYKGNVVYHAGNSNLASVNWTMNKATANSLTVSGSVTLGKTTVSSETYDALTLVNPSTTPGDTGIKFQNKVNGSVTTLGTMGFLDTGYFVINTKDTVTDDMINISPEGVVTAKTFSGALTGNADTATSASKFTTNKVIKLTGSVTGSITTDFSGSSEFIINTTTNHTHTAEHITDFADSVQSLIETAFESPAFSGVPTAPTWATGNSTSQIANVEYVNTKVAALVDSAPGTLDTLNELAAALGDDPNFATTIATTIGTKIPLAGSSEITGDLFFKNPALNTWRGIGGVMGESDKWRVGGFATAKATGYLEIATAGSKAEPIYVRQYQTAWTNSAANYREVVLLDASGNTSFPGTVTASNFTGLASKATADAQGNVITATYMTKAAFDSYLADGWEYIS